MTSDALAEHLAQQVPLEALKQFRAPRAAIVLPLMEHLVGALAGRSVIEFGSGEPLLLAKALVERGAQVTAVDPALADPRVQPGEVRIVAADLFEVPLDALRPVDVTVSTLLFGAPLRQRARRALWPEYTRGERPSEVRVLEELRKVEGAFIERLAAWTRSGGWTIHWSLERLFAAPPEDWREHGFEVVVAPQVMAAPSLDEPIAWARYVLGGMLIARRS